MQVVLSIQTTTFNGNTSALRSTSQRRNRRRQKSSFTKAYVDWTLGEPARAVRSPCSPSSEQYEPEDTISVNEIIETNDGIFMPFKENEVVLKFTLEDAKTKEVTREPRCATRRRRPSKREGNSSRNRRKGQKQEEEQQTMTTATTRGVCKRRWLKCT